MQPGGEKQVSIMGRENKSITIFIANTFKMAVMFTHPHLTMLGLVLGIFVCFCFYVLAIPKIILGLVSSCDTTHSWQVHDSATPLGDQATTTGRPGRQHHDVLSHSDTLS